MIGAPLPAGPTSEVPTFFGPADSPLFGVLHLPGDQRARAGVIICESLGREGIISARFQRILADDLAARGFAVLRFDYLGTGDSAGNQDHEDAVDNWERSVRYGLDYLGQIGAPSITAIGLRAGSLILSAALTYGSHLVNRIVYVDPIGTGRRYLREQTALFRVSAGTDSVPPGTVSIIGGRLAASAADRLRKLTLDADPSNPADRLLVLRPGEPDAQVSALREADRTETVIVDLLAEFGQSAKTMTPLPFRAIEAVVDWVDRAESTTLTAVAPRYRDSARIPTEGPSGSDAVVESIERIGPNGLFAIRTRPEHVAPGHGKVWMFNASGNDPHVGPAREWVELSRRVAAAGAQAVRWDRSGIGNSAPVDRGQWQPVYARQGVRDAVAMAEHAARDRRNLHLIGPCSGSWYAAQAAHQLGAGGVVLVNPRVWTWRIGATHRWQWWNLKRPLQLSMSTRPQRENGKVATFWKRAIAVLSRESKRATHRHAPRLSLMGMGRLGLAQTPDVLLGSLARDRVATTVLLSPWDADLFEQRGGPRALRRLRGAPTPPRLVITDQGDHAVYHQTMLQAIRQVVLESVTAGQSSPVPAGVSPEDTTRHHVGPDTPDPIASCTPSDPWNTASSGAIR